MKIFNGAVPQRPLPAEAGTPYPTALFDYEISGLWPKPDTATEEDVGGGGGVRVNDCLPRALDVGPARNPGPLGRKQVGAAFDGVVSLRSILGGRRDGGKGNDLLGVGERDAWGKHAG